MMEKVQKQILELQSRGYQRSDMRVRGTARALRSLERQFRMDMAGTYPPRKPFTRFAGVDIEPIEGILKTIYVWVPFVEAKLRVSYEGQKPQLILIDADRRILDECVAQIDTAVIKFTPVNITETPYSRVDIIADIVTIKEITPSSDT